LIRQDMLLARISLDTVTSLLNFKTSPSRDKQLRPLSAASQGTL